jgi:hypothetical protein
LLAGVCINRVDKSTEALIQFSTYIESSASLGSTAHHTHSSTHTLLLPLWLLLFFAIALLLLLLTILPLSTYAHTFPKRHLCLPPSSVSSFLPHLSSCRPYLNLGNLSVLACLHTFFSLPPTCLPSFISPSLHTTLNTSSKEQPFRLNILIRLAQLASYNNRSSISLQLLK